MMTSGFLDKLFDTDDEDYLVTFLVCCSTKVETYKWPNVPDKVWVEKTKILMKIPEPKSSGSRRHVFTITGQEIDRRSI